MYYPKVLERVDSPEQIFHRSFSLGAPDFEQACVPCVRNSERVRHENIIFQTRAKCPGTNQ